MPRAASVTFSQRGSGATSGGEIRGPSKAGAVVVCLPDGGTYELQEPAKLTNFDYLWRALDVAAASLAAALDTAGIPLAGASSESAEDQQRVFETVLPTRKNSGAAGAPRMNDAFMQALSNSSGNLQDADEANRKRWRVLVQGLRESRNSIAHRPLGNRQNRALTAEDVLLSIGFARRVTHTLRSAGMAVPAQDLCALRLETIEANFRAGNGWEGLQPSLDARIDQAIGTPGLLHHMDYVRRVIETVAQAADGVLRVASLTQAPIRATYEGNDNDDYLAIKAIVTHADLLHAWLFDGAGYDGDDIGTLAKQLLDVRQSLYHADVLRLRSLPDLKLPGLQYDVHWDVKADLLGAAFMTADKILNAFGRAAHLSGCADFARHNLKELTGAYNARARLPMAYPTAVVSVVPQYSPESVVPPTRDKYRVVSMMDCRTTPMQRARRTTVAVPRLFAMLETPAGTCELAAWPAAAKSAATGLRGGSNWLEMQAGNVAALCPFGPSAVAAVVEAYEGNSCEVIYCEAALRCGTLITFEQLQKVHREPPTHIAAISTSNSNQSERVPSLVTFGVGIDGNFVMALWSDAGVGKICHLPEEVPLEGRGLLKLNRSQPTKAWRYDTTSNSLATFGPPSIPVGAVASNGSLLAFCLLGGVIAQVWEMPKKPEDWSPSVLLEPPPEANVEGDCINSITFISDRRISVVSKSGLIELYVLGRKPDGGIFVRAVEPTDEHLKRGPPLQNIDHKDVFGEPKELVATAVGPGMRLITATTDGSIVLWDPFDPRYPPEVVGEPLDVPNGNTVTAMCAFGPRRFATASSRGGKHELHLWNSLTTWAPTGDTPGATIQVDLFHGQPLGVGTWVKVKNNQNKDDAAIGLVYDTLSGSNPHGRPELFRVVVLHSGLASFVRWCEPSEIQSDASGKFNIGMPVTRVDGGGAGIVLYTPAIVPGMRGGACIGVLFMPGVFPGSDPADDEADNEWELPEEVIDLSRLKATNSRIVYKPELDKLLTEGERRVQFVLLSRRGEAACRT